MSRKIKYRLYALKVTQENAEIAAKERFSRINPGYILVYKSGKKLQNSLEIDGDSLKLLTTNDETWLYDCNIVLIAEETGKRAQEIAQRLNERVDRFAVALEEQEQNLERGNAENG